MVKVTSVSRAKTVYLKVAWSDLRLCSGVWRPWHFALAASCRVVLQVRAIEESKDRLKKQNSYQSRMSKASALPSNADKASIRTQMEADRLERASRGPVTQGSTAQALPGGANITTAGDMGLNSGGCC